MSKNNKNSDSPNIIFDIIAWLLIVLAFINLPTIVFIPLLIIILSLKKLLSKEDDEKEKTAREEYLEKIGKEMPQRPERPYQSTIEKAPFPKKVKGKTQELTGPQRPHQPKQDTSPYPVKREASLADHLEEPTYQEALNSMPTRDELYAQRNQQNHPNAKLDLPQPEPSREAAPQKVDLFDIDYTKPLLENGKSIFDRDDSFFDKYNSSIEADNPYYQGHNSIFERDNSFFEKYGENVFDYMEKPTVFDSKESNPFHREKDKDQIKRKKNINK